jgi:hypothetical protein
MLKITELHPGPLLTLLMPLTTEGFASKFWRSYLTLCRQQWRELPFDERQQPATRTEVMKVILTKEGLES